LIKYAILVYIFNGGNALMTQNIDVRMLLFRARLLLEEGQAEKALPTLEAIQTD